MILSPVLILEDSPEDFEVLERAFDKAHFSAPLLHYKNAKEALEFLEKAKEDSPHMAVSPSIIILDLNMPGMDGFSFLEKIRQNERLSSIPVIVLSTSSSDSDVKRSYKLGANSYVPKPEDLEGYVRMAETLKSYWFSFSLLPSKAANS
jgi:CheY-like chemotaxis protein